MLVDFAHVYSIPWHTQAMRKSAVNTLRTPEEGIRLYVRSRSFGRAATQPTQRTLLIDYIGEANLGSPTQER